jgi:hypothetical protein
MIAKRLGYKIQVHPPINDKARAFVQDADITLPEQLYSVRNHDIVRASDILIAVPATDGERQRGSGTWATLRYAQKLKKPHIVIFLDGRIKRGNS